jgi:hypothetical protein
MESLKPLFPNKSVRLGVEQMVKSDLTLAPRRGCRTPDPAK